MFTELAARFGKTCRPVSRPLRGSGCRIALRHVGEVVDVLGQHPPFSSRNFAGGREQLSRSLTALATS